MAFSTVVKDFCTSFWLLLWRKADVSLRGEKKSTFWGSALEDWGACSWKVMRTSGCLFLIKVQMIMWFLMQRSNSPNTLAYEKFKTGMQFVSAEMDIDSTTMTKDYSSNSFFFLLLHWRKKKKFWCQIFIFENCTFKAVLLNLWSVLNLNMNINCSLLKILVLWF